MASHLKLFAIVYIPMCIGFFVAEPLGMPHVVISFFWLTMLGSGLIYQRYPVLNNSIWSAVHFWCHSIGLPLTIVSFLGYSLGNRGIIQFLLALGSFPMFLSILVTGIRLLAYWRRMGKGQGNEELTKPDRG